MTEHYTGYRERGPYPGEDQDITTRQGGWLYLALAAAVLLTFVSVVLVATWPLAIAAWALVAILWSVELVAKRAAARLQHEHGVPGHTVDPAALRDEEYERAAAARHAGDVTGPVVGPDLAEPRVYDDGRRESPEGPRPSSP